MVLRGPLRSTHVPPNAAARPSMTMAIEKMTAIGVPWVPKWSCNGVLKTLNAYTCPMDRCTARAAGGMSQRL